MAEPAPTKPSDTIPTSGARVTANATRATADTAEAHTSRRIEVESLEPSLERGEPDEAAHCPDGEGKRPLNGRGPDGIEVNRGECH